jgi:hypothetical protein
MGGPVAHISACGTRSGAFQLDTDLFAWMNGRLFHDAAPEMVPCRFKVVATECDQSYTVLVYDVL